MLVLSRRPGESIVVGNQIVVTVLDVRGDQIRIGIKAPRDVQVHREEVYRQLEAENAQAAESAARARRLVAGLPAPPTQPQGTTAPGAPLRPARPPRSKDARPDQ